MRHELVVLFARGRFLAQDEVAGAVRNAGPGFAAGMFPDFGCEGFHVDSAEQRVGPRSKGHFFQIGNLNNVILVKGVNYLLLALCKGDIPEAVCLQAIIIIVCDQNLESAEIHLGRSVIHYLHPSLFAVGNSSADLIHSYSGKL